MDYSLETKYMEEDNFLLPDAKICVQYNGKTNTGVQFSTLPVILSYFATEFKARDEIVVMIGGTVVIFGELYFCHDKCIVEGQH